MESDDLVRQFLKKNRVAIIIGTVLIGLIVVVGVIVAINTNLPFKTSDNDAALSDQLKTEKVEVVGAFNKKFQFLYDRYKIKKVVLMGEGEYAVLLLELDSANYRAILEKKDEEWTVIGVPAVVLYYWDYPEVSKDVIRAANDLGARDDE